MRADISPGWKEKLPGALAALAVQAVIFAALVFSFTVITRAPEKEQEVIFLLPRLKPPPPDPMVIDARPRRPAAGAPPAASSVLPPSDSSSAITAQPGTAATPSDSALLQSLGRALECRPDERGRVSAACPTVARPDPRALALNPPDHVQNPDRWASEKARTDGPTVLPGGNPLGILITALTDPGAFLDKRNYTTTAPPKEAPMHSADVEYLRRYTSPQCPPGMGTDMDRRQCAANARAMGGMHVPLAGGP